MATLAQVAATKGAAGLWPSLPVAYESEDSCAVSDHPRSSEVPNGSACDSTPLDLPGALENGDSCAVRNHPGSSEFPNGSTCNSTPLDRPPRSQRTWRPLRMSQPPSRKGTREGSKAAGGRRRGEE
eukprot:5215027-Pyramimonas_sp.AAC.1